MDMDMDRDVYEDWVTDGVVTGAVGLVLYAGLYLVFNEALAARSAYFILCGYVLFFVTGLCNYLDTCWKGSRIAYRGLLWLCMSCGATISCWAFLHVLGHSFPTMALPVWMGITTGLAVMVLDILSDWGDTLYPQVCRNYLLVFLAVWNMVNIIYFFAGHVVLTGWNILFWGIFLALFGKNRDICKQLQRCGGGFVVWSILDVLQDKDMLVTALIILLLIPFFLFWQFLPKEFIRFQVIWSVVKRMAVWLLMALVSVLLAQMMSDASIDLLTRSLRGLAMIGFAIMLVVWRKSNCF